MLTGRVIAILDADGNVVVSYMYDAWGAPLWCTGELAETLGKVQPFRYRGYVFDEETGLYYLRSRYYNPWWGRFVNADSEYNTDALLGNNQYAYCCNTPICSNDSNGQIICTLFGALCGFAAKGLDALLKGKSSRETLAAAVGGMCTGAINGLAVDISYSSLGLGSGISILISGLANFVGDFVEYYIREGSYEGYDPVRGINQFLSGVLGGLLTTLTTDAVKRLIDSELQHAFEVADEIIEKYGIEILESAKYLRYEFLGYFEKHYTNYIGEVLFLNAATELFDPLEFIPEKGKSKKVKDGIKNEIRRVFVIR